MERMYLANHKMNEVTKTKYGHISQSNTVVHMDNNHIENKIVTWTNIEIRTQGQTSWLE
jgi:hypothetical protein